MEKGEERRVIEGPLCRCTNREGELSGPETQDEYERQFSG